MQCPTHPKKQGQAPLWQDVFALTWWRSVMLPSCGAAAAEAVPLAWEEMVMGAQAAAACATAARAAALRV